METFLIKGLHIWIADATNASDPRLDHSEIQEWLKESGITEYQCVWIRDPMGDFGPASKPYRCWQTGIQFPNPGHAIMFKLAWGGDSQCLGQSGDVL